MKTGFTSSVALHAVALGLGIFTLSSPQPMELGAVESFPVDIVPMEEFSQSVQGERSAPAAEQPAPVPTTRPDIVENAQHVGDNTADLSTPPTPEPRPREVETAEAPPPSPSPAPVPEPEPEPAPAPEPEPVPTTEVAPQPQPQQEVTPEPAPEPEVAQAPQPQPQAEAVTLPDTAPVPQARPQQPPPQAQAARTPERRQPERPPQQQPRQSASSQSNTESLEDEVAALLNRDRASGGGAQRSTEQAALGGRQTTGAQLTQSERDAIIAQLRSCWNVPVGAEGSSELNAKVRFRLDPSGTLQGAPVVENGSGNRQFDESTTRAIRICSQRGFQLPSDKYDTWSEVVVNFSPRDMF